MGILILKYLAHILQVFAIILWSGSLLMILFLFNHKKQVKETQTKLINEFLFGFLQRLEYIYIFSIVFIWSGILIHITIASNNPFKSRLYVLYILLTGVLSLFTLIKIYLLEKSILRAKKNLKLFPNPEMTAFLEDKIEDYTKGYYYLSLVSFLICLIIIFLNQF